MISLLDPNVTSGNAARYHLKFVLNEVKPQVWRRLQLPGNANLGWLHAVLQVSLGWTNSHLHQFDVAAQSYSDPVFNLDRFEGDPPVLNEHKITLAAVAPDPQVVLGYEYDFGDCWQHQILVEKILSPDPATAHQALCLAGAGACPPEDCGGASGYAELLSILRNPKHEEHEAMQAWLGRPLDPKAFDLDWVNAHLRKLKWPRTSETQLAKVLRSRDAVQG